MTYIVYSQNSGDHGITWSEMYFEGEFVSFTEAMERQKELEKLSDDAGWYAHVGILAYDGKGRWQDAREVN